MSYENPWIYNGQIFDSDNINDYFGFVYCITNQLNQRRYLGRKYFWSFRKPPGKKRKVKQESDWKRYYGSCFELKEDVKNCGKKHFNREILSLHHTRMDCNYEETRLLFLNNVLKESLDDGTSAWYNSNILGRYLKKDYGNFGTDSSSVA
jgi:hypothetical protein